MQIFEVEKLALRDQTKLEMSQYVTSVTMEDPIINDGQMSQYGQMSQRSITIGGAGATGGTILSKSAGFK